MNNRRSIWILAVLALIALAVFAFRAWPRPSAAATAPSPTTTQMPTPMPSATPTPGPFNGESALGFVQYQVNLGPRVVGSPQHAQLVDWMQSQVQSYGWQVEVQETTYQGQPVRNVIAKRGSGTPWVIIGAHYDSRMVADQDSDPAKQTDPVPGANDGASGVAVLVELARVLPDDLNKQVWLVFFDSEDNGRLPGWDWILGSRAFVEALEGTPDSVVIVDMIGDADLNIYKERNSDPELTDEIWQIAAEAGYGEQFIPEPKHSMLDDHTPFLENGIRAIDIIDFDYPYWHTSEDTADKVSAHSLEAVGETLRLWLLKEK
ncbi:MAG TPA: M28 family peptidase [Anaerolineaceae bacterium]